MSYNLVNRSLQSNLARELYVRLSPLRWSLTRMNSDADFTFPALVAARLLLAFAPLPDALKYDQQLSSPLTSYSRCALVSRTAARFCDLRDWYSTRRRIPLQTWD